jgi:hypothetical protein
VGAFKYVKVATVEKGWGKTALGPTDVYAKDWAAVPQAERKLSSLLGKKVYLWSEYLEPVPARKTKQPAKRQKTKKL